MRVFAGIVGVVALILGGGGLLQSDDWSNWQVVLAGWMPLFVGGGLALYALFKGRETPFHRAAKFAMWLLLAGFAAYAGFMVFVVSTVRIH